MSKFGTALKAGQTAIELGNNIHNLTGAAKEFRAADKKELGRKAGRHAFSEGAETGKTMGKTWLKTFEVMPRLVCRGLQFIFALIACGFYGHRVDEDHDSGNGFSVEWIYALAIAGVSATTSLLFVAVTPMGALPYVGSRLKLVKTYRAFPWDLSLFIAWLVVFGIFAGIFLHRSDDDKYKGAKTGPMKVAVWIDLVNTLLWLISGVYGAVKSFLGKKADQITDKMGQKLFEKKNKGAAKDVETV